MKYYTGGADELIGFDFCCDIANNIIKAEPKEIRPWLARPGAE